MHAAEFDARLAADRAAVDRALDRLTAAALDRPYAPLARSMRYTLLAGGKRLRPVLMLAFCRACGGDDAAALPAACSLEMLHTYSLIHDDLPCMDNDELRRGRPSNHIAFGECTATLAGDALQALAFETVLSAPLPPARALRCAQLLAAAAGLEGICGGQQLDLAWEGRALDRSDLETIHRRKTGALISAACRMGVAAAGGTPQQDRAAAAYADALGLAFQIRDDLLDVIGDEAALGKPIGSDRAEGKRTFADLLGADGCAREVDRLTAAAVSALDGLNGDFPAELARRLASRMG